MLLWMILRKFTRFAIKKNKCCQKEKSFENTFNREREKCNYASWQFPIANDIWAEDRYKVALK